MTYEFPTAVLTTEPLVVRRVDAAGTPRFDILAAGSRCEVVADDDVPGTYVLVDEHGDEVWRVLPVQFRPAEE